jgi:hypothetical protein
LAGRRYGGNHFFGVEVEEFVILAGSERQQALIALINDLRTKPVKANPVGLRCRLVEQGVHGSHCTFFPDRAVVVTARD